MFTDDIIRRALEEDIGHRDVTTDALVSPSLQGRGLIRLREDAVVAGLGVAGGVFVIIDPKLSITQLSKDGSFEKADKDILEIKGSYASILKGERVALNFLQRLCGIATLTHSFVERTKGTKTKILDTRKTTPLLRHLEKYAVAMGGGANHRSGLYDAILIKDNHIAAFASPTETVKKARDREPNMQLIVEINRSKDVEGVISAGADRVLLDNMSDEEIARSVAIAKGRAETEVSGGITIQRVERLAKMGVNFISIGALTHSARGIDLNLELTPL